MGYRRSYAMVLLMVAGLAGWAGWKKEASNVVAAQRPTTEHRAAARDPSREKAVGDGVKRLDAILHGAADGSMTSAELADCWLVIRSFTEKQIRAYLAGMPPLADRVDDFYVTAMLFQRWAQLDPESAARESLGERYKKHIWLADAVLCTWVPRDMDGAFRWVEANGSSRFKNLIPHFVGKMLVAEDPATALDRAQAFGQRTVTETLRSMAGEKAATREMREEFSNLRGKYGSTEEWGSAMDRLLNAAVEQDMPGLLEGLRNGNAVDGKETVDRQKMISKLIGMGQSELLLKLAIEPSSGFSSGEQADFFSGWASRQPKIAADWALQNGRSGLIADSVKSHAMGMLQQGWQNGDQDRWADGVAYRYQRWRDQDPDAAEEWSAGMPPDLQKHLNQIRDAEITE